MTNEILLRPMQLADIPQVIAIEQSAQLGPWSEKAFQDCLASGYDLWVIEDNQFIQGYIVAYTRVAECHILNLCIKTEKRRQGYAQRLLEKIFQEARRQAADMVFLEVRPSNHAAVLLYQKLGFNEVGSRKNYYPMANGRCEDALIYALQLF